MSDTITYSARARSNSFAVIERPTQEIVTELPTLEEADAYAKRLNGWMKACDEQAMVLNRLLRSRPAPGRPDTEALLEVLRRDSQEAGWLCSIIDHMYEPEAKLEALAASVFDQAAA